MNATMTNTFVTFIHSSKTHFKKWLCQTQNPPRIPVFYTLTEIHKPTPVGRPIISGVSGPTERLSAFVHKLLQPIAQQQKPYLKDTTDFISFMEGTRVPENTVLVSMDVTSLYTNIPQEEGIQTVCRAYNSFYNDQPPIPMRFLEKARGLMLQENSFQFCGKNYLQIHELPWERKWQSMTLSPIFLWAKSKQNSLTEAHLNRALVWKRYIDDIFSLWDISREELQQFIEQANNHHPTIKFTAEIFETEITFWTLVYKGNRFITESVLDIRTHYKATETFQYTHFSSCHLPGVKRGFIKGEALRLLQTNSTKATFEEKIKHFESRLIERGYPKNLVQRTLSEVIFENRKQTLQQTPRLEPRNTTHQLLT